VKLSINQELRQRDVIAQIIEYASSLSRLEKKELCHMLDLDGTSNGQWYDFVRACFPTQSNSDELADAFLSRLTSGQINIVIACDKVPRGTSELVSGVSSQAALGFECDVVEIVPYVREETSDAEVLLVPSIRVSTEIIARTAVDITYREGDATPQATVQVTSLEEIAGNVESIKKSQGRNWSLEEVAAAVDASEDKVQKDLFIYAQRIAMTAKLSRRA
jgi:hypothetical protein